MIAAEQNYAVAKSAFPQLTTAKHEKSSCLSKQATAHYFLRASDARKQKGAFPGLAVGESADVLHERPAGAFDVRLSAIREARDRLPAAGEKRKRTFQAFGCGRAAFLPSR